MECLDKIENTQQQEVCNERKQDELEEIVQKVADVHDIAILRLKSSNGTHSMEHVGTAIGNPGMIDLRPFRSHCRICTEAAADS